MKKATRFSPFAALRAPQAAELSALDKLLLSYLCWRRGGNPTAYPSLKRIESDLQIDRRTCLRTIARLSEAGCIRKVSGGGRHRSNHYEILSAEREASGLPLPAEKGRHFGSAKGGEYVEKGRRAASRTTENNNRTPPTGVQGGDELSQKATVYTADFEQFWKVYPKKIHKVRAFEAWRLLSPGPELVERILRSVEIHIDSEQWSRSLAEDSGRYVPNATKFLTERRWEDEPPARPDPEAANDPDEDEVDRLMGWGKYAAGEEK
ncbi:MAG: helix-turn-helix domain-containing protein [Pirellulales bacterium]|nr:helix-turn-helix domain-containing protein [Pirellulales bacterium]